MHRVMAAAALLAAGHVHRRPCHPAGPTWFLPGHLTSWHRFRGWESCPAVPPPPPRRATVATWQCHARSTVRVMPVLRMRAAAFSLVLGGATAINTTDVPTFRFSCRVTNSLNGPAAPPPPLRPYPEPPCTLNATTCPTQYNGWPDFTCHGSTCLAANYSFSLGCAWTGPCTGATGVETSSGEPPLSRTPSCSCRD